MILTGENIAAEDALKIGLVSRVFPAPEVLMQAETLAGSILARGTAAVQSALHAIRGGLDIPLAEGLAREAELFGQLCASADKKEAIQAFLEKRRSRLAETEA
jgi:enoyl-CoA hydratase/carnithine racemase